jgi:hypothetical protein
MPAPFPRCFRPTTTCYCEGVDLAAPDRWPYPNGPLHIVGRDRRDQTPSIDDDHAGQRVRGDRRLHRRSVRGPTHEAKRQLVEGLAFERGGSRRIRSAVTGPTASRNTMLLSETDRSSSNACQYEPSSTNDSANVAGMSTDQASKIRLVMVRSTGRLDSNLGED